MTQEQQDKQAFFAQYWGQHVGINLFRRLGGAPLIQVSCSSITEYIECLELTPLSSITEEDAIEVPMLVSENESEKIILADEYRVTVRCGSDEIWIWFDGEILLNKQYPLLILNCYDYLRSRGYLLPFRQYSTQQLLDMGWAKLKTKKP